MRQGNVRWSAEPVHHRVGVAVAEPEGFGELGTIQTVAKGQVEDRAVAVGQSACGLGNQVGELGACGQGVGARVVSHGVGNWSEWCFAAPFPECGAALHCGRSNTATARSLSGSRSCAKPGRGDTERVLDAVGRAVAVTQHSHAEVVQPVGVAVVDP